MFFIKLKVPFTNSGEITFYPVEILGLALGAFLIFYFIKTFKSMTKEHKLIFFAALASQLVFVTIYAARVLLKGVELKSILVLESNLFVLAFLFLIILKLIDANIVIRSASVFFSALGVLGALLIYLIPESYTDWTLFHCSAFSLLTFGNAIRTYLILITLPLTLFFYIREKSKLSLICLVAQTFSFVICGMVSGARVNYLCMPIALLMVIIVPFAALRNREGKKASIVLAVTCVLSLALVLFSSQFSAKVYSQMMRLNVTKNVMEALNIEYSGIEIGIHVGYDIGENEADLEDMLDDAGSSAEQSAMSRDYMWALAVEDIKKAPLFGNGLKSYDFAFEEGTLTMQAHNFILEYLLAFGIVGFLFWGLMILTPEIIMIKRMRSKFWKTPVIWLVAFSMFFACGGAFFQPYFLYPNIMFVIFLMMGCYYSVHEDSFCECEEKKEISECE